MAADRERRELGRLVGGRREQRGVGGGRLPADRERAVGRHAERVGKVDHLRGARAVAAHRRRTTIAVEQELQVAAGERQGVVADGAEGIEDERAGADRVAAGERVGATEREGVGGGFDEA